MKQNKILIILLYFVIFVAILYLSMFVLSSDFLGFTFMNVVILVLVYHSKDLSSSLHITSDKFLFYLFFSITKTLYKQGTEKIKRTDSKI